MSVAAVRLALLSCTFAVVGVGCTTAQVLRGSELERMRAVVHVGDTVRTTTTTGVTQELKVAALEDGGTLRGVTLDGTPVEARAGEIAAIEYRKPAPRRTIWLIVGAVLGAGIVAAHDSCKPENGTPSCAY